jgi:hypothetical protein
MGPKSLIYLTENNEHCIHITTYVNICSFYPNIKVGQLPHLALSGAPPMFGEVKFYKIACPVSKRFFLQKLLIIRKILVSILFI